MLASAAADPLVTVAASTDPWLDVPEGAEEIRSCTATVRRAIKSGELRAVRVGQTYRFRRSWLDFWIERKSGPRTLTEEAREALRDRCRKAGQARWEKARATQAVTA